MKKKQKQWQDPFAQRESANYENPVPSRECIADFLGEQSKAFSRNQILNFFEISDEFKKEAMRRRLRAMVRDGQLMKTRDNHYRVIHVSDLIQGRVVGHRDGFGFVEPEDGTERIFISAKQMRTVFDGDLVAVQIVNVDHRNRREGIIQKILERKRTQIVGRFFMEGGVGFVEADNQRINQDIIVPKEHRCQAKSGQMVIVEIIAPPTMHTQAIGRIVETLGDYMAPGMETEVAIRSFELPHQWSESVLKEVQRFSESIPKSVYEEREDIRSLPLVTIDGKDARDFDDAVYCEPRRKGWRLVVAIADVSFYVKPGMALDNEAKDRGNSVYFPTKVIPMLPPILSNELCSLKPNVDRLCFVCDMNIDSTGKIKQSKFYRAVMRSHARLIYDDVADWLAKKNEPSDAKLRALLPHIQNLYALYQVLSEARSARGGLEFESREIKVEFGPDKKIQRFFPVVRNDAHRLIEECMLCANIASAKFLVKHKQSALFRVHDGPTREKLVNLKASLEILGLRLSGGDLPTPKDYSKLLEKTKDRKDARLIQTLLLRSLSQAFYVSSCDPHFGLAIDEYTHFTSPIRRYPDLLVHRVIADIIENQKVKTMSDEALSILGEHCSMTERRADEATRDVLKWLQCEYMTAHLGEEFGGVITGVTGFGFFVEITDLTVEGLVHIATLPDKDYYRFDPARHMLLGQASHRRYMLGDSVRIQVVRVDVENRQIDFLLV